MNANRFAFKRPLWRLSWWVLIGCGQSPRSAGGGLGRAQVSEQAGMWRDAAIGANLQRITRNRSVCQNHEQLQLQMACELSHVRPQCGQGMKCDGPDEASLSKALLPIPAALAAAPPPPALPLAVPPLPRYSLRSGAFPFAALIAFWNSLCSSRHFEFSAGFASAAAALEAAGRLSDAPPRPRPRPLPRLGCHVAAELPETSPWPAIALQTIKSVNIRSLCTVSQRSNGLRLQA